METLPQGLFSLIVATVLSLEMQTEGFEPPLMGYCLPSATSICIKD